MVVYGLRPWHKNWSRHTPLRANRIQLGWSLNVVHGRLGAPFVVLYWDCTTPLHGFGVFRDVRAVSISTRLNNRHRHTRLTTAMSHSPLIITLKFSTNMGWKFRISYIHAFAGFDSSSTSSTSSRLGKGFVRLQPIHASGHSLYVSYLNPLVDHPSIIGITSHTTCAIQCTRPRYTG